MAATILMTTTPIALTCPHLPPSSRYRDNALATTLLPEGSTLTVGMCRLSTGQCLDPLAQFTPEQGRGEEEVRYARPLQNVHLSTFTFCARKRGRKRRKEEKKKKKRKKTYTLTYMHMHLHTRTHFHMHTYTHAHSPRVILLECLDPAFMPGTVRIGSSTSASAGSGNRAHQTR